MEKVKKSYILKRVGWIVLVFVILLIVAFLIASYVRLADKHISKDYFDNKTYANPGVNTELVFFDDVVYLYVGETAYHFADFDYKENIFKFGSGANVYYFLVIDTAVMYCDRLNCYLYYAGENNENKG